MAPPMGFWCDPIWLRLWGFGVTPYGSDCMSGCPYMGLTVGLGFGVPLYGSDCMSGFWGAPIWV